MKPYQNCFSSIFLFILSLLMTLGLVSTPITINAEPFVKGAKLCEECHEEEFKIWQKTKHFTSFRTVHREPKDEAKPSPKKI